MKLCEKELNRKKSTTYTELRRLCDKGILRNVGSVVTAVFQREELHARQSERFVEDPATNG